MKQYRAFAVLGIVIVCFWCDRLITNLDVLCHRLLREDVLISNDFPSHHRQQSSQYHEPPSYHCQATCPLHTAPTFFLRFRKSITTPSTDNTTNIITTTTPINDHTPAARSECTGSDRHTSARVRSCWRSRGTRLSIRGRTTCLQQTEARTGAHETRGEYMSAQGLQPD